MTESAELTGCEVRGFRAGFTAVVQDNISGHDVVNWLHSLTGLPRHLVVLRPPIATIVARHEELRRWSGGH